jgi:hypothetical protein
MSCKSTLAAWLRQCWYFLQKGFLFVDEYLIGFNLELAGFDDPVGGIGGMAVNSYLRRFGLYAFYDPH